MLKKLLLGLTGSLLLSAGAFAQQHGRVVPIDSIQYVNPQDLAAGKDKPSFHYGDTVTLAGRVMFDPRYSALSTGFRYFWLQDTTLPWHGVQVMISPSATPGYNLQQLKDAINYDNIVPGLKIKMTGVVSEFSNNTQVNILPIETEILDLTPKKFDPVNVTVDMFRKLDSTGAMVDQYTTGEPYEGMYVQFNNVTVVDVINSGNGRFYWKIQDSKGNKISIRDASANFRNDKNADSTPSTTFAPPAEGSNIKYLRGVIFHYTESGAPAYYIAPLTPTDVGPTKAAPPQIKNVNRSPVVASATNAVTVYANITDDKEGVKYAVLYYSVGINNTNFTSVTMTNNGNDIYSGIIPAQADGSIVNYWIKAADSADNIIFAPDSLAKGWHYMVHNGGITRISDIQTAPFGNGYSIWENDTLKNISVGGIVTSTTDRNDLGIITVESSDASPYSGIFLSNKLSLPVDSIKRGDSVVITQGVVKESISLGGTSFTNTTALDNVTLQVVSHNNPLPKPIMNIPFDSLASTNKGYGENYEAMLLQFNNVYVTDTNADHPAGKNFGEWVIGKASDTLTMTGLRVDDQSNDIPANFGKDSLKLNQKLDSIKGILVYSFGNWKILPRNRDDISGFSTQHGTGIGKLHAPAFGMYPNPAMDVLYLSIPSLNGAARVQVLDINGKVVREQVVNGTSAQLSLSGISAGVYVVRINDRTAVSQQKLIIRQ